MGSSSSDFLVDEARRFYHTSSTKVKDLAYRFFKSMDTDNNEVVDFQEIQNFLHYGNFVLGPYHPRTLFDELDRDHNNSLDFDEFITFFYIIFLRARCDRCGKCLIGKTRRTCVKCFISGNNNDTYDICSSCYHLHRNKHHHDRSDIKKFEDVVFNGNVPGRDPGNGNHCATVGGMAPPRTQSERLYIALQLAAAIAAPFIPVFVTLAGCSIM